MELYGLNEEKNSNNIQQYNQALFRNMMFFMDVVWQINLHTKSIIVIENKAEPRANGSEFEYNDVYTHFVEHRISVEDVSIFSELLSYENLKKLRKEMTQDVHILSLNGIYKKYRIVLTPSFDDEGNIICIYLGARDIQQEEKWELEQQQRKLYHYNESLKSVISQEEQFRLAALSGAIMIYNINLSKNLIEEEFYEIADGVQYPMLDMLGLAAPCNFDEFCKRWSKDKIAKESQEVFLRTFNRDYLLDSYKNNIRQREIEFDIMTARGNTITIRNTILLIHNHANKEIIASVYSKDVTKQRWEEHRQRDALREAYQAANRANHAKSVFLARMSHEIHTPMNAILGMAALAQSHLEDAKWMRNCMEQITDAASHLLGVINEVLDASSMENGEFGLQETVFDLFQMVEETALSSKTQMDAKRHEFSLAFFNVKHKKVIGDKLLLQKALLNIMNNAIKYTENGGRIKLTVTEKNANRPLVGCYEFAFEDNGIGMSQDFVEHVFDPFSRADDSRVEEIQGTGLGLSISKNLVQMMNGEITVSSTKDEGSRVAVTIFLQLPITESVKTDEKPEETVTIDKLENNEYEGCLALLAEDNDLNAEIATEILSMIGINVEHVWNGEEAVEKMSKVPDGYYDIIFMDIQMPQMNGFEATRAIRDIDRDYCKNVPILAMSANALVQDVVLSKEAGMNEHLAKPIDFHELTDALHKWLKKK